MLGEELGEGGSGASESEELAREGTVASPSVPLSPSHAAPAAGALRDRHSPGVHPNTKAVPNSDNLVKALTTLFPSGGSASTWGSHQGMHTPPLPVPTHPPSPHSPSLCSKQPCPHPLASTVATVMEHSFISVVLGAELCLPTTHVKVLTLRM